ncbi:Peptidyl-prolyl cis-trans isomerase CYP40 [Hordeum vulgare]|nr:Peptidyl-prolyl cis-trans isomerase CYP40 [Hordeum vulgare]
MVVRLTLRRSREAAARRWMLKRRGHGAACPPARQRAQDATEAFAAVDVGEAGSHSPLLRRVHQCRRNRVVVDVGSSQEGSVIDLTSTDNIRVTDEEEWGMGNGGISTPVSRLMSHVLLHLAGDWTDTVRGTASRRTWARRNRTSSA